LSAGILADTLTFREAILPPIFFTPYFTSDDLMATILHYCARNDVNGNPQRLYAIIDPDSQDILAVWDEQYYGHHAVPGAFRDAAYDSNRVDISVRKYKQLLRNYPSPDYAYQVRTYEHLAQN
jgi:hypothetical protein